MRFPRPASTYPNGEPRDYTLFWLVPLLALIGAILLIGMAVSGYGVQVAAILLLIVRFALILAIPGGLVLFGVARAKHWPRSLVMTGPVLTLGAIVILVAFAPLTFNP